MASLFSLLQLPCLLLCVVSHQWRCNILWIIRHFYLTKHLEKTVESWFDDVITVRNRLSANTAWHWPNGHVAGWVGECKLTFYADDLRPVPLAVGATLGGGHVALQEAVGALVACHRMDVVVWALPTNQEGVVHGRGSATQHWRAEGEETGHDMKVGLFACPGGDPDFLIRLFKTVQWLVEDSGSVKFAIRSLTTSYWSLVKPSGQKVPCRQGWRLRK